MLLIKVLLSVFVFVFLPSTQAYLFGCYYDYGQPLVLPEQLPIGICTHVLLIGTVFIQNLNVTIVEHFYNGSQALQSMRDFRQRHPVNTLKIIPSITGGDTEWQNAMINETTRAKFIDGLIQFSKTQVSISFESK